MKQVVDAFATQCRYVNTYFKAIEAMSADDGFEGLFAFQFNAHWAGKETNHLYPFREHMNRRFKLAGWTSVEVFREKASHWPTLIGMKQGGVLQSNDGLVCLLAHLLPT